MTLLDSLGVDLFFVELIGFPPVYNARTLMESDTSRTNHTPSDIVYINISLIQTGIYYFSDNVKHRQYARESV